MPWVSASIHRAVSCLDATSIGLHANGHLPSCLPHRHVRSPITTGLQRQLRASPYPAESMSIRRILLALEVRGTASTLALHGRSGGANAPVQDERHSYEKCQYEEFKKRVAKMDEMRAAKGGARSN